MTARTRSALVLLSCFFGAPALAATCTSAGSGNWNVNATWAAGCTAGGPIAGDIVNIGTTGTGHTVTVPAGIAAAAASVTLGSGAQNGPATLTLATATSSLTLSGAMTINGPNQNNVTNVFNANAGTASMASLALAGGNGVRLAQLAITTGTVSVTGNVTFPGTLTTNGQIVFSNTGTLRVAGALGNGGTLTAGTGTVEYNGSGQTVNATYAYNNLTVNTATTATLGANTTVGGNLTVNAGTLDMSTFTANRTAAGGTLAVAAGARLLIQGTNGLPTNYTTHTFNATSTVEYGGANQPVSNNETYGHVTFSGSGTKTVAAGGTMTVQGNFTLSGVTYTATTTNVNLAGNLSDSGTLNSGTGVYQFNGAAAQSLSGTAANTTFTNLTINNTAALATRTVSLAAGHDATVTGTLTFTSGRIVTTATSKVIIPSGGTVSGAAGSPNDRFVAGRLQKFVAAGNTSVTFEIGTDGAAEPQLGYAPVTLDFTGVGGAGGSLIASGALGDHPQIGTAGLNGGLSVNRWWQLTTAGVSGTALPAFTSVSPTFTFIGTVDPSGGVDAGVDTAVFEIERWDGAAWQLTTAGTRTATSTQATGVTALGEFATAHKVPVIVPPGDLNAFESSTAAGAIVGRLHTKLVGSNFSLDVVAILAGAQHATFSDTVQVDLVTGSTGGLNCPGAPVAIAGTTQSVLLNAGRATSGIFNVATAHRDVRVRIRWPVASPTVTSCSTDNFAIRPLGLTVTSTDATQTGTSGAPAIKTGANFNLTAASGALGYDGTPAIDNAQIVGTPTAGAIGGSFGAASAATGTAIGNAFFYSEVGNFGLNANAVYDASFTSVDQPGGDCTNDFSNTLVGGRYGCRFGAAAIAQTTGASGFGRFIPDNFAVAFNAPQLGTACGTFSYVGQSVSYTTAPVMTVTARNGTNNGLTNATTVNYAGAYMKLTNASLTPNNQAARYTRFDALGGGATPTLDTGALPAVAGDPAIGSFTNGVGALTFASGGGLAFARPLAAPRGPFSADIALALDLIDADGVAFAGNPAAFGTASAGNGIAFSAGKLFRYGRLRLQNALGPETSVLPVPIETQYWNGTLFVRNSDDACTTLPQADVVLSDYRLNLGAGETTVTPATISFVGGTGNLTLSAPGAGNNGSVLLTVNLVAAGRAYLQGAWTGTDYDDNPAARATFGLFGGQPRNFIYFRENY